MSTEGSGEGKEDAGAVVSPPLSPRSATQRPGLVVAATWCLGLSFTMGLVSWAFTAHWGEPKAVFIYAAVLYLMFRMVRALYQGRGWGRWLVIVMVLLGMSTVPWGEVLMEPPLERTRFLVQAGLQGAAVVLLLLPSSWRWYAAMREARRRAWAARRLAKQASRG